jgi:hypothetical protein
MATMVSETCTWTLSFVPMAQLRPIRQRCGGVVMPIAIGLPGGAVQRLVVGVASAGVVVLAVAGRSLPRDFRRFFGPIPPALVLAGSLVIGVIAVDALRSRGWGSVDAWSHSAAGFTAASMFAVAFAVVAVIADCTLRFDVDINVRWPGSLVFYPVIAPVAETVFHLVPLAVLATALDLDFDDLGRRVIIVIVLVASIEAVFQALAASDLDHLALTAFVIVHLFAIGLAELFLFWRHGLAAMVAFRLVYYSLWHIAWGYLRLRVLF